jgi:serine/threonine protein kinase
MLAHPEFYEPIDYYQPTGEYSDEVKKILGKTWRFLRGGVWCQAMPLHPKIPLQGWKIHLSATLDNAPHILSAAVPIFKDRQVSFKFAVDSRILQFMNSKSWDRGASGKFVTVYPKSIQEFHELLEALRGALREFSGPYILSDQRYKDCKVLYYRYGGLIALPELSHTGTSNPVIVAPDGNFIRDIRTPYFELPEWVSDPYPVFDDDEELSATLGDGRYEIETALSFSNSGGVYTALDLETQNQVIIKEARPFTCTDLHGNDSLSLLQKEHRILCKLIETGVAAKPIALFKDWEHLFLVQEFLTGMTLSSHPALENKILDIGASHEEIEIWYREVLDIVSQVAIALDKLHNLGIVFGDFSPGNILYSKEDGVKFIDFEGANEIGVDLPMGLYTPGFAHQNRFTRDIAIKEDDYFALGALITYLLVPVNAFTGISPDSARVFYSALEKDYGIPAKLRDLVLSLTSSDEPKRPTAREVADFLQMPEFRTLSTTQKSIGLTPVENELPTQAILPSICNYILSVSDFKRRDRLFPSDPSRTNPLSLDHGAVGVAYALFIMLTKNTRELEDVIEWVKRHEVLSDRYAPGLYVGISGIACGLAKLGEYELGLSLWKRSYLHPLLYQSFDLCSGAAGVGLAALGLWRETKDDSCLTEIETIASVIMESAISTPNGLCWPHPSGTTPIGFGYGSSGIATFLTFAGVALNNEQMLEVAREALLHDISYSVETERGYLTFPETTDDSTIGMPYLLYGSAGVGSAIIRYLKVKPDDQLEETLTKLLPDTLRKYTAFPGLFNGLAGLGNFLIDYAQFTGNDRYYSEAQNVADGIINFALNRPTGVAFPGDNLFRISTDYGTGSAGIGLFLNRLSAKGKNFLFLPDDIINFSGQNSKLTASV